MVEMEAKAVVVLVEVVVAQLERVVTMVVEVVVRIYFRPARIMKQVMVERVLLGLFGAVEEHFQIPLLMINNI